MELAVRFGIHFLPSRRNFRPTRARLKDESNSDVDLRLSADGLKTALLKQRGAPLSGTFPPVLLNSKNLQQEEEDDLLDADYTERVLLVGIAAKQSHSPTQYTLEESLKELESLAETAGLQVIGKTYQFVDSPSPSTYVGSGKVLEISTLVEEMHVSTVIFDEELSPVQALNLERSLGSEVRVCDRTALILDIFSQRARSKEGQLQVELAQCEYQFPRLTRMWTHLERQVAGAGGDLAVKGMGEKQIEIDKRILKRKIISITKELEEVKTHRRLARSRRAENDMPVIALVGYTNAGKSTLLNKLTDAEVLVEDKLFATLDPTTRKVKLPTGKIALLSDTVGFIEKLPHQLLAAFGATLEELQDSTVLLHVMDISNPQAQKQEECVKSVLKSLGVEHIPLISVWNKLDQLSLEEQTQLQLEAQQRCRTHCVSAPLGQGFEELLEGIEKTIEESMIPVQLHIPYRKGDLVDMVYSHGVVKSCSHVKEGTVLEASVPLYLASQLQAFQLHLQDPLFTKG